MPFYKTKVYGRSGEELHDRWRREGAPSAYAGMAVYDCPNFCSCSFAYSSGDCILTWGRHDYGAKHVIGSLFHNYGNVSMDLPLQLQDWCSDMPWQRDSSSMDRPDPENAV